MGRETPPARLDIERMSHIERCERPQLAGALGAGGEYGIGFNLGVLAAVQTALDERDCDIDLAKIPYLGTSAGTYAAGMISTGQTIERAKDIPEVPKIGRDSRRTGTLQELARELFGDQRAENVHATAVRVSRLSRTAIKLYNFEILDGDEYDLADMAAASGSVPGVFRPAEIDGQLYVDGSTPSLNRPIGSMTYADRAPEAEHLLVTNPCAFKTSASIAFGSLAKTVSGRHLRICANQERRWWKRKNQASGSALVTPDEDTSRLVSSMEDLFDRKIGLEAYERTFEAVSSRIQTGEENDDLVRLIDDLRAEPSPSGNPVGFPAAS